MALSSSPTATPPPPPPDDGHSISLSPRPDGAADEAEGLASGSAKVTIPVLGLTEIISRLQKEASDAKFKNFRSMYSSIVGAITTDVAAMVIPLDDHMVHRGHSVFDTSILVNGYLYELDAHLDRFLSSATKAKITPPFDRATIREILLQTVSAGKCQHGILRFWMSVGRGNFELSAKNCLESSLFACLVEENFIDDEPLDGLKVITSTVPIKHKDFATIKSTNYLLNALVVMEAEEKGANVGIWLDEDGNIAEGQNMNVGFLTNEGELLLPPFDRILSGCTAKRVLELVPQLIKENAIPDLKSVKQTKISLSEAKMAAEMMIIISGEMIMPVVEWDGKPVGNGNPGRVSVALRKFMQQDMLVTPSAVLTLVPSAKPV